MVNARLPIWNKVFQSILFYQIRILNKFPVFKEVNVVHELGSIILKKLEFRKMRRYVGRRNSDQISRARILHYFDNFPWIMAMSRLNPPFQGGPNGILILENGELSFPSLTAS